MIMAPYKYCILLLLLFKVEQNVALCCVIVARAIIINI